MDSLKHTHTQRHSDTCPHYIHKHSLSLSLSITYTHPHSHTSTQIRSYTLGLRNTQLFFHTHTHTYLHQHSFTHTLRETHSQTPPPYTQTLTPNTLTLRHMPASTQGIRTHTNILSHTCILTWIYTHTHTHSLTQHALTHLYAHTHTRTNIQRNSLSYRRTYTRIYMNILLKPFSDLRFGELKHMDNLFSCQVKEIFSASTRKFYTSLKITRPRKNIFLSKLSLYHITIARLEFP